MPRQNPEFEHLVSSRGAALRRVAYLLVGDWQHAEDLTQTALVKTWEHWSRLRDPQAAEAYARTTMTRLAIRGSRRAWRNELPTEHLPDSPAPAVSVDDRLLLVQALRALPPRQRAVVVLRYFADLTEEQTASTLGCAVGTVKSSMHQALSTLRKSLEGNTAPVDPQH